jgi:hypothetical protein
MNSSGKLYTFRLLARQWKPVTENTFSVLLGLFLLRGSIEKPTLRTYFSRRRILSAPEFGVHSGPVAVMKWRDKRNVSLISTYHDVEMKSDTRKRKKHENLPL